MGLCSQPEGAEEELRRREAHSEDDGEGTKEVKYLSGKKRQGLREAFKAQWPGFIRISGELAPAADIARRLVEELLPSDRSLILSDNIGSEEKEWESPVLGVQSDLHSFLNEWRTMVYKEIGKPGEELARLIEALGPSRVQEKEAFFARRKDDGSCR